MKTVEDLLREAETHEQPEIAGQANGAGGSGIVIVRYPFLVAGSMFFNYF